MSYTQGFNPSPKLSFAAPLPLFQEGLKELADIELASPVDAHSLTLKLNRELPPEVQILECHELKEVAGGKKSLASLLGRAIYMALPQFDREMNEDDRALTVSEMTAKFVVGDRENYGAGASTCTDVCTSGKSWFYQGLASPHSLYFSSSSSC
ncbi:MAG: DUF2344 domain-containing protein [Candidatus Competibacteraceae bacterium]|nr:DUF2344 domain-containing protein [Candidatus Competibacteraceae bacterium]